MNKLLNDALRVKGYKGPDIKMVLTDVTDPNGPYYTDPLTNVVVFDRKELAKSNRDQILNALGHEFGHYSKEDDKTRSQTIANYTGGELEKRTKDIVSKEATEETLARIRNKKNVITGEEGKKLAESIPMERREYEYYYVSRPLDYSDSYYKYKDKQKLFLENPSSDSILELYPAYLKYEYTSFFLKNATHGYLLYVPTTSSELKEANEHPEKYFQLDRERVGRTYGGHNVGGKLKVIPNQSQDVLNVQKVWTGDKSDKLTPLEGYIQWESLKSSVYSKEELDKKISNDMENYIENQEKIGAPIYNKFGLGNVTLIIPSKEERTWKKIKIDVLNGYNCNSVVGTMKRKWHIKNLSGDGPGIDPGWGAEIPEEMFKRGENRYEKNFNNIN